MFRFLLLLLLLSVLLWLFPLAHSASCSTRYNKTRPPPSNKKSYHNLSAPRTLLALPVVCLTVEHAVRDQPARVQVLSANGRPLQRLAVFVRFHRLASVSVSVAGHDTQPNRGDRR